MLQLCYNAFMGLAFMNNHSYNKPPIQENETFSVDIRKISTVIMVKWTKIVTLSMNKV